MPVKARDLILAIAFGVVVCAMVMGSIYIEYTVWSECRMANSFLYCLRVMG